MNNAPRRIEGQIWIDKNSPHRLKYYVNGQEYTVEVSGNYSFPALSPGEDRTVYCGTVVKLSPTGYLIEAKFPEDISDVLGIIGNTTFIPAGTSTDNPIQIAITKNGWIKLFKERSLPNTSTKAREIENVFIDYADQKTNGYWCTTYWNNVTPPSGASDPVLYNLLGAPVYWCLDSNEAGKLTLSTPSGFYWKKANTEANISYYNLPQIGNISKIEVDDEEVISVEIHVNFSKFDTSLEWSWPAWGAGTGQPINPTSPNYEKDFTITHGIKISSNFKPQTSHHVTCIDEEGTEHEVIVETEENYSEGICKIITSNPYNVKYRVSGEVNFRVNMSVPASTPDPTTEP